MRNYKVESVEIRKRRNGEEYLLLKISDKMVSFFENEDIEQNVKDGDIVSCKVVQKGTFFNGYNLQIIDRVSADTSIDNEIVVDDKKRENNSMLYAGGRTYYFDVKETSKGDKYLIITEQFKEERSKIFIYNDHAEEFGKRVAESLAKLK